MNIVEGADFVSIRGATKSSNSQSSIGLHDVSKLFCDHCKRTRHTKNTYLNYMVSQTSRRKENLGMGDQPITVA